MTILSFTSTRRDWYGEDENLLIRGAEDVALEYPWLIPVVTKNNEHILAASETFRLLGFKYNPKHSGTGMFISYIPPRGWQKHIHDWHGKIVDCDGVVMMEMFYHPSLDGGESYMTHYHSWFTDAAIEKALVIKAQQSDPLHWLKTALSALSFSF
jgi:hypothetical protein